MKDILVVIDPGHYAGYNPWAISGYYEGTEMFILALMLQMELQKRGIPSILTKSTAEENPGLYARGQMAVRQKTRYKTVVFLSLHDNAPGASAQNPSAIRGTMIFTSMYRLEQTRGFLTGLQKVIAKTIGCGTREMYSKAYTEVNPRQDWWGVIRGAMDGAESQDEADLHGVDYAAIIEHDFHTNPDYCRWMAQEENKRKVAVAEAQYIADYFAEKADQTSSYTVCNGTLRITYGGSDGVNLHQTPDLKPESVIGALHYNELRRAVGIRNLPDGTALYRLEDGEYITASGSYVQYTSNEFASYVAKSITGGLNVRNFPSSLSGGGEVIAILGKDNQVDVIGECYNLGQKWLMIRMEYQGKTVTGFVAARYLEDV
ncbi:MAG: N-acetylmuramoyl-L-alanine amidase [Lachnospiraceae bacterium]|nr:N-acetylmuramoyl-L-alanine amidase [Lachnospiraceae bacterium]